MDGLNTMVIAVVSAGFALATGVTGTAIGIGKIASGSLRSVHHQPKATGMITKNMLIAMAITESSAIFALVIAIILLFTIDASNSLEKMLAIMGAGISVGLGNLGSGLGKGLIGERAIEGIAENPTSEPVVARMMLLTQAITDSPAIFSLVISFSLIFIEIPKEGIVYATALLSAGLCMGIGAVGPAYGSGYAAGEACNVVAKKPETFSLVLRPLLVGMSLAQSCSVYAMVIALCLMYFS